MKPHKPRVTRSVTIAQGGYVCYECGVSFFVDADWAEQRVHHRLPLICPAGHATQYDDTHTEAERLGEAEAKIVALKAENRSLSRRLSRAIHLIDQLDAAEAAASRSEGVPA